MVTALAQMPDLKVSTIGTMVKAEYSRVRQPVVFSPCRESLRQMDKRVEDFGPSLAGGRVRGPRAEVTQSQDTPCPKVASDFPSVGAGNRWVGPARLDQPVAEAEVRPSPGLHTQPPAFCPST